jgi:hypothetical protein
LRPEFVKNWGGPALSSDAFSGWAQSDPNRSVFDADIEKAAKHLHTETIPKCAAYLSEKLSSAVNQGYALELDKLLQQFSSITDILHEFGVNTRYLGIVRDSMTEELPKCLLLTEMMYRSVKRDLERKQRELMEELKSTYEAPFIHLVLRYLNILGGHGEGRSRTFWGKKVRRLIECKYGKHLEVNWCNDNSLRVSIPLLFWRLNLLTEKASKGLLASLKSTDDIIPKLGVLQEPIVPLLNSDINVVPQTRSAIMHNYFLACARLCSAKKLGTEGRNTLELAQVSAAQNFFNMGSSTGNSLLVCARRFCAWKLNAINLRVFGGDIWELDELSLSLPGQYIVRMLSTNILHNFCRYDHNKKDLESALDIDVETTLQLLENATSHPLTLFTVLLYARDYSFQSSQRLSYLLLLFKYGLLAGNDYQTSEQVERFVKDDMPEPEGKQFFYGYYASEWRLSTLYRNILEEILTLPGGEESIQRFISNLPRKYLLTILRSIHPAREYAIDNDDYNSLRYLPSDSENTDRVSYYLRSVFNDRAEQVVPMIEHMSTLDKLICYSNVTTFLGDKISYLPRWPRGWMVHPLPNLRKIDSYFPAEAHVQLFQNAPQLSEVILFADHTEWIEPLATHPITSLDLRYFRNNIEFLKVLQIPSLTNLRIEKTFEGNFCDSLPPLPNLLKFVWEGTDLPIGVIEKFCSEQTRKVEICLTQSTLSLESLLPLQAQLQHLVGLKLDPISLGKFGLEGLINAPLVNLRKLDITGPVSKESLTEEFVTNWEVLFPQLTELALTYIADGAHLWNSSLLTRLVTLKVSRITIPEKLPFSMPALQRLIVNSKRKLSTEACSQLLSPSLKYITFGHTMVKTPEHARQYYNANYDDKFLLSFSPIWSLVDSLNLTCLILQDDIGPSPNSDLSKILATCPNLESLHLEKTRNVTEEFLILLEEPDTQFQRSVHEALVNLKSLKLINLPHMRSDMSHLLYWFLDNFASTSDSTAQLVLNIREIVIIGNTTPSSHLRENLEWKYPRITWNMAHVSYWDYLL